MGRTRIRVLVAVVGIAAIVTAGLLSLGDGGSGGSADTRSTSADAGGSAKKSADSPRVSSQSPRNTVTNGKGSEVIRQPDSSATGSLPGLGGKKKRPMNAALIKTPLPKTASREGDVVHGFPVAIVPVARNSSVKSSGVSSTKSTLQVSIQATSASSPDKVLAFYRQQLSANGFAESSVPAVGGSQAAGFARNHDNLVVTVAKTAKKGTTYSVFGTLHTGKS